MNTHSTAEQMTQALKKLIIGCDSGRPTASAESTAEALVASSLIAAKPNPMACPKQLTEMMWDEELPDSHWPLDDETLFYSESTVSSYNRNEVVNNKNYFDLNISLPLIVPHTTVRVLNSEGENYLHSEDQSKNVLFGHYEEHKEGSVEEAETDPSTASISAMSSPSPGSTRFTVVNPLSEDEKPPVSVCDVWASFLRIQVGTIRNCKAYQIQEITEIFLSTLKHVNFTKPIEIQCSGVYQGQKNRLETRAKFINTEDLAQFRIIRRALKLLVLKLRERFSVNSAVQFNHRSPPTFTATISPVCKTGAYLPIELRRYSCLSKDVAALVKGGKTVLDVEKNGETISIPLVANCLLHEVRLEMMHARAVDPRWTDSWVMCRRMPMTALITPGRKLFASIKELPKVVYEFSNPKVKLSRSRFGALYMLTESALNLNKKKDDEEQAEKNNVNQFALDASEPPSFTSVEHSSNFHDDQYSQLRAEAIPFFPINALSQVLQNLHNESVQSIPVQQSSTWDKLVESALAREQNGGMDLLNVLRNQGSMENRYHHKHNNCQQF